MSKRYSIADISALLATRAKLSNAQAEAFVRAVFQTVTDGLEQDGLVKIRSLGTFKLVLVSPRASVDVRTGEPIQISSHNKVTFTPDEKMKAKVNRPFSGFQTVVLNEETPLNEIERIDEPAPEPEAQEALMNPVLAAFAGEEETAEAAVTEPVEEAEATLSEEVVTADEPLSAPEPAETIATEPESSNPIAGTAEAAVESLVAAENTDESAGDAVTEEADTAKDAEGVGQTEDTDALPDDTTGETGRRRSSHWKVIALVLALVLAAALGYILAVHVAGGFGDKATGKPSAAAADTLGENKADTAATVEPVAKKETCQLIDETSQAVILTGFETDGTLLEDTLEFGEYPIQMAEKYYGNAFFVKYINEYNELKDPSNVPIGTVLKIPRLKRK